MEKGELLMYTGCLVLVGTMAYMLFMGHWLLGVLWVAWVLIIIGSII